MDVTLHERTPVDFELEIRVSHAELEPRVTEALKAQRKRLTIKGFRPGRVPMNLVRKMVGPSVAQQIAEEVIGEAWRTEVGEGKGHEVLGAPRLDRLSYELGQDLHAVLRYGVRPVIELADTRDVTVRRLVRPVTDADVEDEIARRRRRAAPLEVTDEPADAESVVVADFQVLDRASGTPVVGQRDADQEVDLTDRRLREELREALLGRRAGESVRVELPQTSDGDAADERPEPFLVTIKEVRARRLPNLDEAFARQQTAGRCTTVEDYRALVRRELEEAARRVGEDFLREEIVRALLAAHDFPVPEAAVEAVLDEMEEDLVRRVGGELPAGFDRAGFRAAQREAARQQVRWTLLRARLLEEHPVELTDADFEAEFERLAATGPGTAEMVRQFVAAQPQLLEGIRQRLVADRLFAHLAERFTVREVTVEELEAEEAAQAGAR